MRNYVAFVHGIGTQSPGDYAHFERAVRRAFSRRVGSAGAPAPPSDALTWQTAYWAKVTQTDQDALKRLLDVRGAIQTFLVDGAGDAAAYSRVPGGGGKYSAIQQVFTETLNNLSDLAAGNEGPGVRAPLTVIAHSLGAVIATGAIAALNRQNAFPDNLELKCLYTLGSPIALYGLRYGLAAFTPPLDVPTWVNFFYPHDMIAFPLQPLGGAWKTAVQDEPLSHGGGVGLWAGFKRSLIANLHFARNVISHSWYFEDRRILDTIGEALAEEWLTPAPDTT